MNVSSPEALFRIFLALRDSDGAGRSDQPARGGSMWTYANPVKITFGAGAFAQVPAAIAGRRHAVVTYPEPPFADLAARLATAAGDPVLTVADVAPNPDFETLRAQVVRFSELSAPPEAIVAIGGGSVIDSAKVFAAAAGDFGRVQRYLEHKEGGDALPAVPIIAVSTTAGTGSEVTCWATVWDTRAGKKYSLARPNLYPEAAIVDPDLTLGKPHRLTVSTGLDALSHALESLWNVNANPISARFAVDAAREILECLPALAGDLNNHDLRTRLAKAALLAGLAFSNTKTALAHNLSYPLTLRYGVEHGIACSVTLPAILRSVAGIGGFREAALQSIFGADLPTAAEALRRFLCDLDLPVQLAVYGVSAKDWEDIVDAGFAGERGRNFLGERQRFDAAARHLELV